MRWPATPTTSSSCKGALASDDASELADRIAELAALGFDRVYLHGVGTDQTAFLDRAERDLLPALRSAL